MSFIIDLAEVRTVVHPPNLETDDPSLATEILPAPPPIHLVLNPARRDLKRPLPPPVSYLPALDPGSTYSSAFALRQPSEHDPRRRKRPRILKSAILDRPPRTNGRTRALDPISTHHPLTPPPPATSSPADAAPSRSTSSGANDGPPGHSLEASNGPELPLKLEDESPQMPEILPNNEHCSSCRSQGALLYCDSCPRSFHLWCLNPPLEREPDDNQAWHCPSCSAYQAASPPATPALFSQLMDQLQANIPLEFELPSEIRNYFKDVTTGPRGYYQDNCTMKLTRTTRNGIVTDERDAYKLKDKDNAAALCFRCGKSAIPRSVTRSCGASPTTMPWQTIVSCDYCNLHWHLDCLDPPQTVMPPHGRKWMCPNHLDQILPKRRVPKLNLPMVDIIRPNQPNNGNIEIIPSDDLCPPSVAVDEVFINAQKYRIPERVVILDFWSKVTPSALNTHRDLSITSLHMLSPLTSLSSLDDEPHASADSQVSSAVEALCSLRLPAKAPKRSHLLNSRPDRQKLTGKQSQSSLSPLPSRSGPSMTKASPFKIRIRRPNHLNGQNLTRRRSLRHQSTPPP